MEKVRIKTYREKRIIDIVKAYGQYSADSQKYVLAGLVPQSISWTFWNDDIAERTDDNGFTVTINMLTYDKYDGLVVHFHLHAYPHTPYYKFDEVDDIGNNFAIYIYERMAELYPVPFKEEIEEDFPIMTICRQDIKDSFDSCFDSEEEMQAFFDKVDCIDNATMLNIAREMGDSYMDYDNWREDLRFAFNKYDK